MSWTDLGNPSLRKEREQYFPFCWPDGGVEKLSPPETLPSPAFHQVLSSRRSRREFGKLRTPELSALLWMTCREVKSTDDSESGVQISMRPMPSAGSIHPIHILISRDNYWLRYVPSHHALNQVISSELQVPDFKNHAETLVSCGDATLLLFLAEPGKVFSKYKSGNSLIWRDAGVMLGYLGLAAEALDLNFCPLGTTGDPWARNLDKENRLVGVGMALVGSRSSTSGA